MYVLEASLKAALQDFVVCEARLCDESRYAEWEALWAEDGAYWVPCGTGDYDPAEQLSHIYDNRKRIHTRVQQLATGFRYSQVPPSPMRRLLTSFEFSVENDRFHLAANFFLPEYSIQAVHDFRIWSGCVHYVLSRREASFQMHLKKVVLVNGNEPIPTLSFLI